MTTLYVTQKGMANLPDRPAYDQYKTEPNLVRAAYQAYWPELADCQPNRILDPGAGEGVWGSVAREAWPESNITGVELQSLPHPPAYDAWRPGQDYRDWAATFLSVTNLKYDLVVGNPPYRHAEEFIQRSWQLLKPGGIILFLLRLSFQSGVRRCEEFWPAYPLSDVGIVVRRPSFYGNSTNATDYGIFMWRKGQGYPSGGWPTRLVLHARGTHES